MQTDRDCRRRLQGLNHELEVPFGPDEEEEEMRLNRLHREEQ
jgi:hypothetical protein